MPMFARWRAERELQRKATEYVAALFREPADEDAQWLAAAATRGDADHAQWELRYARRARSPGGADSGNRHRPGDRFDDCGRSATFREVHAEHGPGIKDWHCAD